MNKRIEKKKKIDVKEYANNITEGKRVYISKAITLTESILAEDKESADKLLEELVLSQRKRPDYKKIISLGISGTPGVGKSTAIEQLGLRLIEQNKKVGVLTVDPSSTRTGGSILGDKVRMTGLAAEPNAYVRSSPSNCVLGGLGRGTQASMKILEAAGFDVVIVETVGVGQSEVDIEKFVDFYLLLLSPGGGDELQGIKKGVVEVADGIVITKADGDLLKPALIARNEYATALRLFTHPKSIYWTPRVLTCSSKTKEGIDDILDMIFEFKHIMEENNELDKKRQNQAVEWMNKIIKEELMNRLKSDLNVNKLLPSIESKVKNQIILPCSDSKILIDEFLKH